MFSATEAYLIEDGKVTAPVKGATLIGNGPETMQKVAMIGHDMKLDDGVGVCGKDGQSVPVGVGQACAIAGFTEDDAAAGLADPALMATTQREFDGWHPWDIDAQRAIDLALACEQAGRDSDPRVSNSDGASVNSNASLSVYANSHGFLGGERSTSHSIGCALIAGEGEAMQRDSWYSAALAQSDLESAADVGRKAAQRTVERLQPRHLPTAEVPVLFHAEIARSLVAHYVSAISGGALYRRASFLMDSVGQRVFPDWFGIDELPFLARGFRSAAFDAEGVATRESPLVREGVVQRYVLGSYSARKLGLATTRRSHTARRGRSPAPAR